MNEFAEQPSASAKPAKSGSNSTMVIVVIVLAVVLVIALACGGILLALLIPAVSSARDAAREAMHKNNLRQLGVAYMMHWDEHQDRGPKSWDDLSETDAQMVQLLDERQIEVNWGIGYKSIEQSGLPASQIILAYPQDSELTDEESVAVLMADGGVVELPYGDIPTYLNNWEADQSAQPPEQLEP